jgi:hypothetical protein
MAFMTFIPGIELSRRFYAEAVAPVVGGPHTAALVGPGSEVLGFDPRHPAPRDWLATPTQDRPGRVLRRTLW